MKSGTKKITKKMKSGTKKTPKKNIDGNKKSKKNKCDGVNIGKLTVGALGLGSMLLPSSPQMPIGHSAELINIINPLSYQKNSNFILSIEPSSSPQPLNEDISKLLGIEPHSVFIDTSYKFPVVVRNDFTDIKVKISKIHPDAKSQQLKNYPDLYFKKFKKNWFLNDRDKMILFLDQMNNLNKLFPGQVYNFKQFIVDSPEYFGLVSEKVNGIPLFDYFKNILDSMRKQDSKEEINKLVEKLITILEKYNDKAQYFYETANFIHDDLHFYNVIVDANDVDGIINMRYIDIEPSTFDNDNINEFNSYKHEHVDEFVYKPLLQILSDKNMIEKINDDEYDYPSNLQKILYKPLLENLKDKNMIESSDDNDYVNLKKILYGKDLKKLEQDNTGCCLS